MLSLDGNKLSFIFSPEISFTLNVYRPERRVDDEIRNVVSCEDIGYPFAFVRVLKLGLLKLSVDPLFKLVSWFSQCSNSGTSGTLST